jgi:hypothetical protein
MGDNLVFLVLCKNHRLLDKDEIILQKVDDGISLVVNGIDDFDRLY